MNLKKRFLITLIFALAMMGAFCAAAEDEVHVGEGIYISDIDVSGMTYDEAQTLVEQRVWQMRSAIITVQVGEDSIETTASELGLQWDNKNVVQDAIDLGNSGNPVKRYKDRKDLDQETQVLSLKFSANANTVRDFIEEKCKQFEKEPQDASISADGNGGFDLQEGVTGQVINVDESVKAVQEYIAGEWQGGSGTVALSVELEEPRGDTKDLETIQDMLGSYTTPYGSTNGRNANVERGAELINDHVVWPGETFSVCDHLVPFTAENGYELAPEYAMGRVVQGYGGGICQVSTTLYNALLQAELEIVERHNHTMTVSYVPYAMDAAIAEGNMDLVFRNNLDTPILISGYAYGGELTFTIWGKETRPADRSVYYYSNTLSETYAEGVALYAAPDQAVGYFNQVQSAMAGVSAECWKQVTYNGETTSELVNTSYYEATPASWEVGTLGASDALLNAIYANNLEAAQAAALGVTTQTETGTQATDPVTTEPPVTDIPATDAPVIDTPATDYMDPNTGYDTGGAASGDGSPDGVVVWE